MAGCATLSRPPLAPIKKEEKEGRSKCIYASILPKECRLVEKTECMLLRTRFSITGSTFMITLN